MSGDPYRYFRVEGRELLEQLSRAALDLETSPAPAERVAHLLRLAHTLKGAARVVKELEIADHAHAIEDALAAQRGSDAAVPGECVNRVLALLDRIGARLVALGPGEGAAPRASAAPDAAEPARGVRVELEELDALLLCAGEAHAELGSLRAELGSLAEVRRRAELLVGQLEHAAAQDGGSGAPQSARSLAEDLRGRCAAAERGLGAGVERSSRELDQLREAAERLRLVPVRALFTALERAARDAAQQQGKRARFEGMGGDVRLDARSLVQLQAALIQLVRNALAHGIETEAERTALGKPGEGRVRLEVARSQDQVVFACSDDGRGVDVAAVRAAAVRAGLAAAQAERLTPQELFARLLGGGGITTSTAVTEISGRGIGLDVVRETARQLGGQISLQSEPGRGARFELRVPVSVAAFEALLVEAGGARLGIPLDAVRSSRRLLAGELTRTAQGETLLHEGSALPFVSLEHLLSGAAPQRTASALCSAVVIEGAAGLAALGVDRVCGTAGAVLRALPALATAAAYVAGASLAADGTPQLVLDPDGLVAQARRVVPVEPAGPRLRAPILVIDDSLTTRMLEQSILESAGYQVDVACSAEEALESAQRKRYGLFLVDVEMPGIDGFSFVERTRADPALRDIPAILVSSRASAEDRRRGREAGALAHIAKGEFDQRELLERIRGCLG